MSIVVTKRPASRCWSGNPIHYTLYSSDAEAEPTNYFEIRIRFQRMDAPDYVNIITLTYKPVLGTAKIDIQDILDGLLEYEMPFIEHAGFFTASQYNSNKATGHAYIQYREITEDDDNPDWVDDESDYDFLVVKGGISWEKWRGDNYWINYFDVVKPFLTWEKSGCLHSLTERMYLAWLNTTAVYVGDIKIKRTVQFTDGSQDVVYIDCPCPENYIVYIPTGGKQLKIDEIDNTKNIHWWELQVYNTGTNPEEPMSGTFRYYLDNRYDYNGTTLNFRNSLGGISSARIRGTIQFDQEFQFTQQEKLVLHDYYLNQYINGRIGIENSTELLMYKGDIGHMEKEEQDRMRDLHLRREVWQEVQEKWIPIAMLTPSQKLRSTTDKLYPMPVLFCVASGGDYYYTPRNINLQEGNSQVGLICTAVIGNLEWEYVPGTGWIITWDLLAGTPVKYYVSTPAVSGGAPHETLITSYTFTWLPVGDNVITVQPLCYIGGVYYFGASHTVTVTVEDSCVGVGISSPPVYLPDAVEDVPYNYVINLTGTAPFSLSAIVKPAWMNISIVGSTVEITGTPTTGDIASEIDVSFTVSNCSDGNTVDYADTIDVLAAGANGTFTLTNDATAGNYIKNVFPNSPAFYTLSTGMLPLNGGNTATGVLTSGIATPISVFLIIASAVWDLELYKNGVLQETITILGSGIYSFAAVSFLITDNMEIKLKA